MSYGTNEGFEAWLAGQGLVLPDDAPSVEVLRNIGSFYVDAAYEHMLSCSSRTGGFDQPLAWPRTGHRLNGKAVPSDLVPTAWVQASYRAGYLQAITPGWATNSVDATRQTRREKVDVVEREYFKADEAAGSSVAPGMASDSVINGMLTPWFCAGGRDFNSLFRVV